MLHVYMYADSFESFKKLQIDFVYEICHSI